MRAEIVARQERAMARIRLVAAFWGLVQVEIFPEAYPGGVHLAALCVMGLLALSAVMTLALQRRGSVPTLRQGWMLLGVDVLVASATSTLYGFDPNVAIWTLSIFVALEAAVRYGVRGARWTWGALCVLYLAGQGYDHLVYGIRPDWASVLFRMVVIGVAAAIVALLSRELSQERDRLERIALTDGLTGLPNRAGAHELLRVSTARVIVHIDIDGFQARNAVLGHVACDEALQRIGAALDARADWQACRWGSDAFVILVADAPDTPSGLQRSGFDVAEIAARAGSVPGHPLQVSTGVARRSGAGENSGEDALDGAERAASQSRIQGGSRVVVDDDDLVEQQRRQSRISTCIQRSVDTSQVGVAYQPIVSGVTGSVSGFEALLRLRDEEGRVLPADEVIANAERSGSIHALGALVLEQALTDLAQMHAAGHNITMSVNASGMEVGRSGFASDTLARIRAHNISTSSVQIELTETALVRAEHHVAAELAALRGDGVGVAIDDFGTGFASLTYLRALPASAVKIDQSFVRGLPGRADRAIIRSVVSLAQELGLRVIAEGVEESSQLHTLVELGVEHCQGYLLGRPVDAESARALLREKNHALPAPRTHERT